MYSNSPPKKLGIMNYNDVAENVYFDGIKNIFFYNNELINNSIFAEVSANSFNTADDVSKNDLNLL